MSSDKRSKDKRKDKSLRNFWRACTFLIPYWKYVLISTVCAFFVSGALAGGLGTMIPIMRVFLNGDTVQSWVDRTITQRRLGVTLSERTDALQIVRIQPDGAAAAAGINNNDTIYMP